jgi:hypothetical protein
MRSILGDAYNPLDIPHVSGISLDLKSTSEAVHEKAADKDAFFA